jgi:hypothetical protein
LNDDADDETRDALDLHTSGHDENEPGTLQLPSRRHLSPWTSRRLLLISLLGALLLMPLWLDPTTLRELRSVTPSPTLSASGIVTTAEPRPLASVAPDPRPGVVVARDGFGRVSEHTWGTADLGGGYSYLAEGSGNISVGSGHATVQIGTDGAGWTMLSDPDMRDADVLVSLAFSEIPVGLVSAGLIVRAMDDAMYNVRVTSISGRANLVVELTTPAPGNEDELLAGPVALPEVVLAPGAFVRVRVQATGSDPTTVRAKAWLRGSAEPDAWQLSVVDWTGRLQFAGGAGLSWNVEHALPNGVDIYFDDLEVWSGDLGEEP